jgi:ribosomal-protein-alanine N-acetyltransferase
MGIRQGGSLNASLNFIRPTDVEDASRMSEIDRATSPNPRSKAQYEDCCRAAGGEQALVCERARQILGFVVYSRVLDEASINNIAVDPGQQGAGVGRALLCAALDIMRESGAGVCHLEVRASNKVARSLYKSLGFLTDGRRKNYYRTDTGREDALLMSLAL